MNDSNVSDPVLHELNRKAHQVARAAKRYVETRPGNSPFFYQLSEAVREYEKAERRAMREATL